MWIRHCFTALLVLACPSLQSQLTIENPKHLEVPEHLAQALFLTASRITEAEFHSPASRENRPRMRLVLGQTPERLIEDDQFGNGTMYLEQWNENKFAFAAMRLAVLRIVGPKRQERMLREIVRRAHDIAPVSAVALNKKAKPSPRLSTERTCLEEIIDTTARGGPCGPPGIAPDESPHR